MQRCRHLSSLCTKGDIYWQAIGGGGARKLATQVDSLATSFDLEAYRRRRTAAVPWTIRWFFKTYLFVKKSTGRLSRVGRVSS